MKILEATFWIAGIALVLIFLGAQAWGEIDRQRDLAAFGNMQLPTQPVSSTAVSSSQASIVDAVTTPAASQPEADEILAILRIAGVGIELPVRYGTEERVLRRGPGLIEGTSPPGSNGNVAIAAHRDRHFRDLKDLAIGDSIELEMSDYIQTYIVTGLTVVEPTDVHVLDETGQPVLTLVTCYPFYFVGNAPKRFIVRAEAAGFVHRTQ